MSEILPGEEGNSPLLGGGIHLLCCFWCRFLSGHRKQPGPLPLPPFPPTSPLSRRFLKHLCRKLPLPPQRRNDYSAESHPPFSPPASSVSLPTCSKIFIIVMLVSTRHTHILRPPKHGRDPSPALTHTHTGLVSPGHHLLHHCSHRSLFKPQYSL